MRKLNDVEDEIQSAQFEAFVYIGERLFEIREKRLYEQEDYRSWSSYCRAGRLEFKKSQADKYIRAMALRKKLGQNLPNGEWTQWHMLALAECETDNDAKRVARDAVKESKKTGEPITAKMIGRIRDAETNKAAKALTDATLEKQIDRLADYAVKHRVLLERVDVEQWEDVPTDTIERAIVELGALVSFLKG